MTEPQGEQIPISEEETNKLIDTFTSLVKSYNMELSNKELTELIVTISPVLMKLEAAIHRLEASVKELENKK